MMDPSAFLKRVREIVDADTSADSGGWTPNNPLWGHCVVVSLLAQDEYGGEILRASLKHIPKYADLGSHYWNRLSDGKEVDFTAEQYPDLTFEDLSGELRERERILVHPATASRYKLLKSRFTANVFKMLR